MEATGRHYRQSFGPEVTARAVDGGYTQSDVVEFAKVLTRWTHG